MICLVLVIRWGLQAASELRPFLTSIIRHISAEGDCAGQKAVKRLEVCRNINRWGPSERILLCFNERVSLSHSIQNCRWPGGLAADSSIVITEFSIGDPSLGNAQPPPLLTPVSQDITGQDPLNGRLSVCQVRSGGAGLATKARSPLMRRQNTL